MKITILEQLEKTKPYFNKVSKYSYNNSEIFEGFTPIFSFTSPYIYQNAIVSFVEHRLLCHNVDIVT